MANKSSSGARSPLSLVVAMALCCFFYVLGAWQRSGYGKGDRIAAAVNRQAACGGPAAAAGLSFETHHGGGRRGPGVVRAVRGGAGGPHPLP